MIPFINEITCMDWRDAIVKLPDNCIDLVVTDPPYGMGFQSSRRKLKHDKIIGDDNIDWIGDWVDQLKRVCKEDSHMYVFCSWHNVDIFKQELSKAFNVKNILIWEKNNHGSGDLKGDYAPKYEMIIFCSS